VRQVAADEAEATRDHHRTIAIELAIRRHGFVDSGGTTAADGRIAEQDGRVRASSAEHDELHPEPHDVDASPEHALEVEELRTAVEPVVMVHRNFDDAKAGILNLAHHLQADDAGVFFQLSPDRRSHGASTGNRSQRRAREAGTGT
jgi:hypothetical protein